MLSHQGLDVQQMGLGTAGKRILISHTQQPRAPIAAHVARELQTHRGKMRTTSLVSESKLTNTVGSFRSHAACAKAPPRVVFAVPGEPVTSIAAPLKNPPPNIASRRCTPVDTRSLVALLCDLTAGATHATLTPVAPITYGASFLLIFRAAVLEYAQAALRDAADHGMVQLHHAVPT